MTAALTGPIGSSDPKDERLPLVTASTSLFPGHMLCLGHVRCSLHRLIDLSCKLIRDNCKLNPKILVSQQIFEFCGRFVIPTQYV